MSSYLLDDPHDFRLGATSVKIHLLKHPWDGSTLKYCRWVFGDDSVERFDAGLIQVDHAQLQVHRILEPLDESQMDKAIAQLWKDIH